MTEITQADRDAAEQYDVVEAFARHREAAAAEERAKIVAWLRRHKAGIAPIRVIETLTISKTQTLLIDAIEAKEHLK